MIMALPTRTQQCKKQNIWIEIQYVSGYYPDLNIEEKIGILSEKKCQLESIIIAPGEVRQ